MDIDDEEQIERVTEPPKRVRIRDVRVCILEGPLGFLFIYAYPFADLTGGQVKIMNTSDINKAGSKNFDTKVAMWVEFYRVRKIALKSNPTLKILHEGKILRDDYYGKQR